MTTAVGGCIATLGALQLVPQIFSPRLVRGDVGESGDCVPRDGDGSLLSVRIKRIAAPLLEVLGILCMAIGLVTFHVTPLAAGFWASIRHAAMRAAPYFVGAAGIGMGAQMVRHDLKARDREDRLARLQLVAAQTFARLALLSSAIGMIVLGAAIVTNPFALGFWGAVGHGMTKGLPYFAGALFMGTLGAQITESVTTSRTRSAEPRPS